MTPPLTISSTVIERLQHISSNTTGRLYGVMYDNALTVIAFDVNVLQDEENASKPAALQLNMPVEVDLCGVLFIGECEEEIPAAFKDIDITDNPLLIEYSLKDRNVQAYYYVHEKLKSAEKVEIIEEEDIWRRFSYIRVQTSFPIVTTKDDVIQALQDTRKNIASGNVGFRFPQNNVYILGTDGDSKNICIKELASASTEGFTVNQKNQMIKNAPEISDVIDATMLCGMSHEKIAEASLKGAPALHHVKRPFESLQFDLQIDALSVVGQNVTAAQLYAILVESVCRNIRLIEKSLVTQNKEKLSLPIPYHFKPRPCGHLITVAYPVRVSEQDLREYRKGLHKVLALDVEQPYFKRGNAVKFFSDLRLHDPLLIPHAAIASGPHQADSKIVTVKGLYAYHHYMQDNFDDNGWGCAYRSLQTIVSWYRLQGYTDENVPCHRDIQKCLVEIGDKAANFIGSRQWIGSTEVGFVLQTVLGVTFKVLRAENGKEMPSLASDLAYHFATQGTPIMIGGGVLAHTILGISYNYSSDETKYLILDPHYTGPDDLTTILNKGWCGWKDNKFWREDSFYNMCLPQKPICI